MGKKVSPKEKEPVVMKDLPNFNREALRTHLLSSHQIGMVNHIRNYIDSVKKYDEIDTLIFTFFNEVKKSKNYLRGSVNDFLLDTIIRDTRFRLLGLPKSQILKRITTEMMETIKKNLLENIAQLIIGPAPEPKETLKNKCAPKTINGKVLSPFKQKDKKEDNE
jgi:hypothetical protein